MFRFLDHAFPLSLDECLKQQQEQTQLTLDLLAQAKNKNYDLLVTAECVNYLRTAKNSRPEDKMFFPPLDSPEVHQFALAAQQARSWLIAGLAYREASSVYNAALIFDRDGSLRQIYRKTHLTDGETAVFTPGSKLVTQDTDFGRVGVCICWDMQFPEVSRTLALRGAQLVVCPTWGWEANLYGRARAYENGIYVAAAMAVPAWGPIESPRTPSSIIAPDGQILASGSSDRIEIVSCKIDLSDAEPFRRVRLNGRRPALYTDLSRKNLNPSESTRR